MSEVTENKEGSYVDPTGKDIKSLKEDENKIDQPVQELDKTVSQHTEKEDKPKDGDDQEAKGKGGVREYGKP